MRRCISKHTLNGFMILFHEMISHIAIYTGALQICNKYFLFSSALGYIVSAQCFNVTN